MSYMGDRGSSKGPDDHVTKLLRNVMSSPAGLRDEVFLQLCKQTTENPKEQSTLKGWELIICSLITFPPSKALRKFLYAYIAEHAEGKGIGATGAVGEKIQRMAEVALSYIPLIMKLGQRLSVPSINEIHNVCELKEVVLRVYLMDGSYKTITVDSFTLIEDVIEAIKQKLQLTYGKPFALYEVTDREHILNTRDRVLDVMAKWVHGSGHDDGKHNPIQTFPDAKFLYKAKLVLKADSKEIKTDTGAVELLYMQSVNDVVTGKYPVKDKDLCILAALQLQATFGDFHADMHGHGWLTGKLDDFIPIAKITAKKKNEEQALRAEWEQKILHKYEKVKGFSTLESKLNFLDFVQEFPTYGITFFEVAQRQWKDYPSPLLLGITCEGALLVHPVSKQILDDYRYVNIVTWGHSEEKFILVVGNVVQQRKLVFKTNEGAILNQLVHDYVKHKVSLQGQ
jgi:MyTH4 domain/FERM central domain/RA like domain/PTB domain (IRS-1 type)